MSSTSASTTDVCGPDGCAVPSPTSESKSTSSSTATPVAPATAQKVVKIDIVSDTICPWCFVGKRRLEAAIKQLDASKVKTVIEWHPFQLDPTLPAPGKEKLAHYRAKFGAARTEAMLPHMQQTGLQHGIKFNYGGKIGNTINSHRLVEFAKRHGKQNEMVETLMKGYFEQEQDVSDVATLVKLAGAAGLNTEEAKTFLESAELKAEVRESADTASSRGISGVPHFTIDGRYAVSGAQDTSYFLAVFKKLGVYQ